MAGSSFLGPKLRRRHVHREKNGEPAALVLKCEPLAKRKYLACNRLSVGKNSIQNCCPVLDADCDFIK